MDNFEKGSLVVAVLVAAAELSVSWYMNKPQTVPFEETRFFQEECRYLRSEITIMRDKYLEMQKEHHEMSLLLQKYYIEFGELEEPGRFPSDDQEPGDRLESSHAHFEGPLGHSEEEDED